MSKSGNYVVYAWNGALRTKQFLLYQYFALPTRYRSFFFGQMAWQQHAASKKRSEVELLGPCNKKRLPGVWQWCWLWHGGSDKECCKLGEVQTKETGDEVLEELRLSRVSYSACWLKLEASQINEIPPILHFPSRFCLPRLILLPWASKLSQGE